MKYIEFSLLLSSLSSHILDIWIVFVISLLCIQQAYLARYLLSTLYSLFTFFQLSNYCNCGLCVMVVHVYDILIDNGLDNESY